MNGNGDSHYATLAARITELETALQLHTRRLQKELLPRLIQVEHDVDHVATTVSRLTRE